MATEVGNIHIGLYVDVGESRRFTDVANLVERDSRRMNSALGGTSTAVRSLRTQMSQSLRFKLAQDSLKGLSQATNEVTRLRSAMLGLAAITGAGVGSAFSASYFVQTADKARLLDNQIKTVTSSTSEFASVQDRLFQVSQRTRTSLEATTQIYARTARATEQYGYSQEKLLRITETIQKAFAVGGATPEEARGAALQLSQGIASNRFGGEEFRSVSENAPVLLRGIAESVSGGDIGKLRKMSMDGKLTAQVVTEAIVKASSRIDGEFSKMTPTVAQAFTTLDNAFLRYTGRGDQAYGITKTLSAGIVGLADNFEDVMYWVTRVTAGLAGLYAARKLVVGTQGRIAGVRQTNAGIREEMAGLVDQNKSIDKRRGEIAQEIGNVQAGHSAAVDAIAVKQSQAVHAAKEKEYLAQKGITDLEAQRNAVAGKLVTAQGAIVSKLQSEVETSRQMVRDNALRVIQAQLAAEAEERILRAKQAQRVAKAGGVVDAASGSVSAANSRVGDAAAAIERERELARVKIAGEIDARRQQIVTQTQRLRGYQDQISELRQIKDLQGFDEAFGSQYRKLLEQQQKAMISTRGLRDELSGLQKNLSGIDSGDASTRGISGAMTAHAKAIKAAEAAVNALSKAEEARNKIAAAPVGGKTLDARLAAEQKELARYETSVTALQGKLRDLQSATAGAFDNKTVTKMAAEINSLDQRISGAQSNLRAASKAVADAQAGDTKMLGAALAAQSKAYDQINGLQKEAAALIERQTVNTNRLAVAQQRLNVLRRVGGNVVDFFGGWTGIAITGSLLALSAVVGHYAAAAQESSERTARLKKELNDLGLLSDEAAGKIDAAAQSMDKLSADKVREKLRELNDEIKKMGNSRGFFEGLFGGESQQSLGDIEDQLNSITSAVGRATSTPEKNSAKELREIVELAKQGKTPSDELLKRLEEIAAQPLSERMDKLIAATRAAIPYVAALRKEAENLGTALQKPAQSLAEQFRSAENKSMTDLGTMNKANQPMLDQQLREANWTEYESRVQAEMDKIIKAAEKLGNTMTLSSARVQAENIIAADTAKKGLRDLIGYYEGTDKGRGYNETLDYGKYTGGDVNLTQMTLNEVLDLQRKMLADPNNTKNSSAVGRYQITRQTLKDFMGQLGLSGDDVFNEGLQDRLADAIIRSTGGDTGKLRGRWEGLKSASDQQISTASDQTFLTLPRMDESTQKWVDGLKDLDLQNKVQTLNEFNQRVLQTAQSMGASNEELQQYIAAVSSGQLDQVPQKFKAIVDAMKSGDDVQFGRQLKELQASNLTMFLSDVDQQVVETARSFGVAEEQVRAFILAALGNGQLGTIAPEIARIRDEAQKTANDESLVKAADGLAEGIGNLASNLITGTGSIQDFWKGLLDLAVQLLIIEPLVNDLKTSFRGIGAGLSTGGGAALGGGGGGIFGGLMTGIMSIFGFDEGGWTGPGEKEKPAGYVHADEFVFNKKATRKAGVGTLNALHEYLQSGKTPKLSMRMPGYMDGGAVAPYSMTMPSTSLGAIANDNTAVKATADNLKNSSSVTRVVVESNDEKLRVFVRDEAGGVVKEASPTIVGAAMNGAKNQVIPTMAKFQNDTAGGDYRNA